MEDGGWIKSDWDKEDSQGPARWVYELTEDGKKVLIYWGEKLQITLDLVSKISDRMNSQM